MSDDQYRTKWTKKHEVFVSKAILSADPVSSRKDCFVVVIYSYRCRLALIRLEQDTRWTFIDARIIENVNDIVYAQDKLYVLDHENKVFSCDISVGQLNFTLVAESFENPVSFSKRYMLESSDGKGLLMIIRYMQARRRRHRSRITVAIRVFKLDAYHGQWAEIYTLDDATLFVGDSVISVMASNFLGCVPNCIYFIRPRDFGVYDLTHKRIFRFGDAATPTKMSTRTPIWTMASIKL